MVAINPYNDKNVAEQIDKVNSRIDEIEAGKDKVYTFTKSLKLTNAWQDTGIQGDNLRTGTYVVSVYNNDTSIGFYHYRWSGICSWFEYTTNGSYGSSITLNGSGHARNGNTLYLQTLETPVATGKLKLQIKTDVTSSTATNVIFKFRKLLD